MMKKINKDNFNSWKEYYFEYQCRLAKEYYIPLLKKSGVNLKNKKILDVGCGDGGFISAFAKHSTALYGIEIKDFDWPTEIRSKVVFLVGDLTVMTELNAAMMGRNLRLIILRDVIEHIPNNEKLNFLKKLKVFADEETTFLITFPPFYSPFGLHQQVFCKSILRYIPYLSILPLSILKFVLHLFRENKDTLDKLLEIRNSRMSIGNFIKIYRKLNFKKIKSKFFTIRPSHELRYGFKTRKSYIGNVPLLRELFVTGVVFILKIENKS